MSRLYRLAATFIIVATLGLTGFNTDTANASTISKDVSKSPVNLNCPIMGHKVTEKGGRTLWKGKTIGFCCPGCINKWDALSNADKATKLAKAGKNPSAD